jgi:hypothetical protein
MFQPWRCVEGYRRIYGDKKKRERKREKERTVFLMSANRTIVTEVR